MQIYPGQNSEEAESFKKPFHFSIKPPGTVLPSL